MVEGQPGGFCHRLLAQLLLAERSDLPHLPFILQHLERVPGLGDAFEPQDLHGDRGARILHAVSQIVEHGAHLAVNGAGDERVADPERAALHEDSRDRPTRAIESGLKDYAGGQG